MARTTLTPRRRAQCRTCRRWFYQSGKGRPRAYCIQCAPPGTKHPERLSPAFSQAMRDAHQRNLARREARAVARRTILARHHDEYEAEVQAELEKRGVA